MLRRPTPGQDQHLMDGTTPPRMTTEHHDLDPKNWDELRALGHRMLDDMFDHMRSLRDQPVWRPMPDAARAALTTPLPQTPSEPADIYADIQTLIAPYTAGNAHPRFMGWVQGGGNAIGVLSDMIASALNPNCGGRNHAAIEVERQVVAWSAQMLGLPPETTGVIVTGSSLANFIALTVARTKSAGPSVRRTGVGAHALTAYTSKAAHSCLTRAADQAGLGSDAMRLIRTDAQGRIDLEALRDRIATDREAGLKPFLVTGTAGTVSTGAVDNLAGLAALCREESLWFHVDAAYGAFAMLSPTLRPQLAGIEQADSVAFDFHKWGQVPYDAGIILVRDPEAHLAAFDHEADYQRREKRGLGSGQLWPCDLGPDLSRGFKALKVWTTLRTYGAEALGRIADQCCQVAAHIQARVQSDPRLELLAPLGLNIVCFRVKSENPDALNADILADIQEAGIAAPSSTLVDGHFAIRAAIVNHRTRIEDADAMLNALLQAAQTRRADL